MISAAQFYEIRKNEYDKERDILTENSIHWCDTILNQRLIELAKDWCNEHTVLEFRFAKSGGNPNEMRGYQAVENGVRTGGVVDLGIIMAKLMNNGYQVQRHYVNISKSNSTIPCWDLEIRID